MAHATKLDRLERDLGELLEARGGQGLDRLEGYRGRIVAFAQDVLGFEPWEPHQREVLEAVLEHPQVHVQGGNATGKDAGAAVCALYWTFVERGRVLVTSAVERQLTEVFMGEVGRLWRGARGLPGELYRSALRVPGEDHAGITTFTSTAASRMSGFHAPRVLAILSEAQAVEAFAWEGLMSCAAGSEDRLLAVGNPLSPQGRFYRNASADGWHSIRIPVTEHPNLRDDTDRTIPGGPSADFVKRMRREWGEDSEQFTARIEARFPTSSSDSAFKVAWVERAMDAHTSADDISLDLEAGGEPWTIGVDVAGDSEAADLCVAVLRRGPVVYELRSWSGLDTMATVQRLVDIWEELKADTRAHIGTVVVDSIGIGKGVTERLRETHITRPRAAGRTRRGRKKTRSTAVEGFDARKSALDADSYRNLRSQAFWRLRTLLEDGEILLPDDAELFEELTRMPYRIDEKGKIWFQKDDVKARIGRSPDRADALMMSLGPALEKPNPKKVRVGR